MSDTVWTSMEAVEVQSSGAAEAADFAQRILQIINEGTLTSTYKLALLLSLMDVCMERTAADEHHPIPVRELASKMVDLYWQQTLPYPGRGEVLQQSGTAGQAKIVSLIQEFRVAIEHGQPISAFQAKVIDPEGYQRLVRAIEEQLYRYVLLKLQAVGGASDPFIYDLPPGADARGQGSPRLFADGLRLRPGVAGHLVRFEPLLRPLIQQRWAQHVAGLRANSILRHVYELEEFLFGADRMSLAPVVNELRDLQGGRCFYCHKEVGRDRHVDHFIPWSRYRDNGLENLVFADGTCNLQKHAYLAGLEHLEQWLRGSVLVPRSRTASSRSVPDSSGNASHGAPTGPRRPHTCTPRRQPCSGLTVPGFVAKISVLCGVCYRWPDRPQHDDKLRAASTVRH